MNVLLLSAYAAASHEYWRRSLQRMMPDWQWQVLSLPPRHFSWRVRGNPLYWSLAERETLQQPYDLVVATSMVDLATLRGLVPSLSLIPSVLYFHENQFEYPQQPGQQQQLEAQMVSIYGALAADCIVFNSRYNRDSFLAGCKQLFDRLPDFVPANTIDLLRVKSRTLPVAVAVEADPDGPADWPAKGRVPGSSEPLRLVWIGRFEHDKGGVGLLHVIEQLAADAIDFELAVVGRRFRRTPEEFVEIEKRYPERLVHFGYVEDKTDYYALLRGADMVVATALHEFQGLAVMEAVLCGCLPVVPDRLAYREIYASRFRYPSLVEAPEQEASGAAALIRALAEQLRNGAVAPADLSAYGPGQLALPYRSLLTSVATASG